MRSRASDLRRKNLGFWKPIRPTAWERVADVVPTSWDLLDRQDIGPRADWVRAGQKIETLNGELTALIVSVEERGNDCRVFLAWNAEEAPKGPQAWTLTGLYEYWRPVFDDAPV